jgi:VCBS repeat-containing protein
MELTAFSDRGIGTRDRLEDYAADRIITTPGGLQLQIAMVCDGAGGGEAGELAARLTSRTIFEYLEITPEQSVPKLLIKAVEQANKAVYSELHGTGTSTVALAAVHLNDPSAPYGRLYIANVGNSRIYLMRENHLVRLNIDHTLQNEYVFAGQMSVEEARQLEDPEYVTRAIGIGAQVSVDIGFYVERGKSFVNSRRAFRIGQKGMLLQEGDTVFAASDGLFPFVKDDELLTHALDDDVERATRTLMKYAADRGPEDNIALSMLFVPSRNRKMVQTGPRLSRRQRAGISVFLLATILLIGFLGIQAANGEQQRVAFIANQTLVQQMILESSYTPTPTPLPPTPTPTEAIIIGQVGNRFAVGQNSLPVFTGRFIDPLNPSAINYVSIAGLNVLSSGKIINNANLYLQPSTSLRLNQVIDTPGKEHIDLLLGHNGDLFVNAGDYENGGISIALEQNPDIVLQSQSACMSAKQIPADASKSDDTDKVLLACYGGDASACTYHFPGADPASVAPGQQALLDINNQKLISTRPLTQDDIDTYRQTIWALSQNVDQLNCLSSWLDEDHDGVNYPTDLCPNEAGSVAAQGCPDTDNDGVPNSADQCPLDIGPASNNGCPLPDVDGDNLAGTADACPFNPGPASNQGCPLEGTIATEHAATQTAVANVPTPSETPTETPTPTQTPTSSPTPTPTPTETPIPKPNAVDDNFSTEGGTALIVNTPGVMANDNPNGGTVEPLTGVTARGGTISLNSNGSFTYTPPTNYVGLDNFTYTLTNEQGSDSALVVIDVLKPPSPPPVASFTMSASNGPAPLSVTFTNTSTGPYNSSSWDFNGDGISDSTLTNPTNIYNSSGTFTVTLTVTGPGGTDSISQTVTVFSPPVASNDTYTTAEDTALNVGAAGVLTNDTYSNKPALSAVVVSNPAHGTLALNANGGFTYTPSPNYNGSDSFTYRAQDGSAVSNTATVTITITAVNDPPVAVNDAYNTAFKQPLTISAPGLLSNDTDVDGNTLTAAKVANPANGTVTVNGNGSFTYTPNLTFSGTDTFTYQANDGTANSNIATVTITVGGNTAPVANSDSYNTTEDTTLNVAAKGVLTNDTDVNGDTLTAVLVTNVTNGTLVLNGATGAFTYTPNANFNGTDTFTYHANDGALNSANVTVTINVSAVNDAPVAANNAYTTNEDTPLTVAAPGVLGNDTDVDGDPLTAVVVTNPTNGTLTLNSNGSLTYTPNANYNGTDTFTYRANDGTANSNTATVTLTITAVNDVPVAVNDAYTTPANNPPPTTTLNVNAANGVRANDSDVETATNALTVVLDTTTSNGTLALAANGSFTYTPTAAFTGTDTFTYHVSDGVNNSNIATVTIAVGVNSAPVANDDTYTTPLNTAKVVAAPGVLANDTDLDTGDTLTAVNASTPGNGTVTLNTNGGFTYTPNTGFTGNDSFTYQVNDGTTTSNVATVTIAVGVTNTAPVAVGNTYTTTENIPLSVAAPGVLGNDTDANGDTLTAVFATGPTNGSLLLNPDGSFSYIPNGGFSGTDTFTYFANDGTVNSAATATVTITVNPVPVANDDTTYSTQFNTPLTVTTYAAGVLGNDTPATGLTATLVVSAFSGAPLTLNANGSFTYTPLPGFFGTDIFLYQASNGTISSNVAAVFINVGFSSTPPTANADNYTTPANTALTTTTRATGVLANDTDSNGNNNTLVAYLVSNPTTGTLTLNGDGTFTYTPPNGFIGSDTFTYQVSDGFLFSGVATVTITVGSNQAPTAVDDLYTTPNNTPLVVGAGQGVLVNDTDPENDPLTAGGASTPANGTVTLNADGSFTYTPNAAFSGTDTFTYMANDGTTNSNIATVTINVGINTPPIATGDTYTMNPNQVLNVAAPGVLANDSDPDGSPITAVLVGTGVTAHGTVVLNTDGSFTYTPNAGFKGIDTFSYNANDGFADSTTPATVTIRVGAAAHSVAVGIPVPPPATACTDTNFENPGMIRSHFTNDIDRANLFCRLIAANGSYMYWYGSPITSAGNVGAQNVLDLGLVAAVDVFSTTDVHGFVGDVDICLKGTGYMIYMNRLGAPRVPQLWSAWTTDAFPGYTCTTLYAPGTVILVANKPK